MLDRGRISSVQLLLVLFMADLATSFLFIPSIIAEGAGPDGWLSLLVPATVYALAVVAVCVALAGRFPRQVFTEYLPQVLGRIPGKLLAAAFTLVLIHLTSVVISESSTFIHTAFLRETPPLVLDVLMMAVVAYGVYLGIEVITRQNELVFPIFIFSLTLLIALAVKDLSLDHLRPVLGGGIVPVLKGAMVPAVWRGEVFFILMLYPYLNQKQEALQAGAAMVLLAAVFGALIFSSTIGVFGSQISAHLVFPAHELARYISVAGILERMELYLVTVWIAGVVVKLNIFVHSCCIAAASTLGLQDYRRMIIPVVITATAAGEILYSDYLQLVDFLARVWPFYGFSLELLLPALILLAAVLRKKGGGRVAPGKNP